MAKIAEILCIGTELLMGDVVNTNAAFIARALAGVGIHVYHQSVVGDNPSRLKDALRIAFSRADIVITTGGLGPTYDDLSKETIASYFSCKLVMHEPSLAHLTDYFTRLGREMTENNKKQAMMPECCTVFENPNGTAPGCAIERDGKTAILLPGPPREMGPMFEHAALPFLRRYADHLLVSHNLHFFGIGESSLEDKLRNMMLESQNPTIAPYAKTGEVLLRITASVQNKEEADGLIKPVIAQITTLVGEFLYGVDVGDLQTAVVHLLTEKGLQVAVAESCTGGMVTQRITDVAGASKVFECAVCSYSDRIKHAMLGVATETLAAHGAISAQSAQEMAAGIRRLSGADIAIAVTGNAGPDTAEGKPVGLVYITVDSARLCETITLHIPRKYDDARAYIRTLSSSHALNLILKAARLY